jgi:hypothetical protein
MSRLRDERGTILALSAVMIPVFLLLTALVIDVGNWYTHKRQLQNRADAAAFAAGVEYAKSWQACVYNGADATKLAQKAATAQKIADAARQYAGDPESSDYAGGVLPATPLRNTEIATQGNVDVMVNSDTSRNYMNNSDYTDADGGVGAVVADPCYVHPADDISAAGQWTDVKVKERDLPSLFGGIGLPLPRNIARARIEIRPATSGRKFLPLAIPNNVITKAQIRYYDDCRDPNHISPLAVKDLAPLPNAQQAAFAALGGGILWGLPKVDGDLSVGDANRGFDLNIPEYDPTDCNTAYLPVSSEVRIASRDEVDFNQSCSTLLASKFADCFGNLSLIRVWDDGNPAARPLIKEVTLTGGCATRADGYFGPYTGLQPVGARTCNYGATVNMDFGTRYPTSTNFKVQVNGVDLLPPNGPGGNPNGVWVTSGTPLVATTNQQGSQPETGDNPVHVKVFWTPPTGGEQSYPSGSGAETVQQTFIGTQDTAGAIDLVRNSASPFAMGLPSAPLDNVTDGGVVRAVFPSVGIRSVLRPGIFTTLRTESSQGSQLVACDPAVASGQEFTLFKDGCQPWFGANPFVNGPWWNTTTRECPDWSLWYGSGTMPAPYLQNSSTNPWRCVLQAPGSSVGQTGDWMIVATQNCKTLATNKCQNWKTAAEANCGNYDGTPADPTGANSWLKKGGDLSDPRVISVFIVPYQALKGVSGSKAEIPILSFASFYVMGWRGQNASENDPCPDPDFNGVAYSTPDKGTVQGVFVTGVNYEPGPVDSTAICTPTTLEYCRATLVR